MAITEKRRRQLIKLGLMAWYRYDVPICAGCGRVHLVQHKRRKIGLCAKCERKVEAENAADSG